MKHLTYLISIWLFLAACSGSNNDYSAPSEPEYSKSDMLAITDDALMETTTPEIKSTTNNITETDTKIEKQIIKTANISIQVENFKKARTSLDALLKKYNAYIADEYEETNSYQITSNIIIRVKSDNFDSLLNNVSGLAVHVNSKHIKLSDVTEEFIDISLRLKNKKKVEQQYLEILKKARTINEILQVNEHIRVIREEIESKEGRLKYLKNQVSLSTINLSIIQNIESQDFPSFGHKLYKAFEGGWEGILIFALGLVYLWPFILILSITIWLIIRYRKKRKQKKNN